MRNSKVIPLNSFDKMEIKNESIKQWAILSAIFSGISSMILIFFLVLFIMVTVCNADTVPVDNGNVLSGWFFEKRIDRKGNEYLHSALDFPANKYTPVKAVVSGEVINADYDEFLGNYVDIYDGTETHRYGHLQAYFVKIGEHIAEGQVFANVSS